MSSEAINEEVDEVVNEEGKDTISEVINEEGKGTISNEINEEEPKQNINEEETKPVAKPKATPKKLARTVKVVELVECQACNKKMLPKSLKNTHPHYCKGQPTETLPVNKQKASYGSKIEQKLRKEIEEEMKKKYETKPKETEQIIQYTEPIEMKTKAKPVDDVLTSSSAGNARASPPVKMEEPPRQLTARELLEASYNEIRKAKREAHIEKINSFKSKMF